MKGSVLSFALNQGNLQGLIIRALNSFYSKVQSFGIPQDHHGSTIKYKNIIIIQLSLLYKIHYNHSIKLARKLRSFLSNFFGLVLIGFKSKILHVLSSKKSLNPSKAIHLENVPLTQFLYYFLMLHIINDHNELYKSEELILN